MFITNKLNEIYIFFPFYPYKHNVSRDLKKSYLNRIKNDKKKYFCNICNLKKTLI